MGNLLIIVQELLCASCIFENDVPKHITKEITGHKSDCVQIYKCTSDKLHEEVSHTVSKGGSEAKKIKLVKAESIKVEAKVDESEVGTLRMEQMIENMNKTKVEMHHQKFQQAKSRLSLKRFRKANRVTIDLNVNVTK